MMYGLQIFLVVGFFLVWPVNGIIQSDKDKIERGIRAAEAIVELVEDKKFTDVMTKTATHIRPYLSAISPFVGLFMSFIPQDYPIQQQLTRMMNRIDNRFDLVEERLKTIQRTIYWNPVAVHFGAIELNILTMHRSYKDLFTVPRSNSSRFAAKANFISEYPGTFQKASKKLYEALVLHQGNFVRNLADCVIKYTQNDRRRTQEFLMSIKILLLQAITVELAYYTLNHQHNLYNDMSRDWEHKIQEVNRRMMVADVKCKHNYHPQLSDDIDKYAIYNASQSHSDFATGLFRKLDAKYYWRHWIVFSYDELRGSHDHWVKWCGGYHRFRFHGRNFVVASVDDDDSVMDLSSAEDEMEDVSVTETSTVQGFWMPVTGRTRRSAKDIFYNINRSDACSVGVIKYSADWAYYYHSSRFVRVSRSPYYTLHMWG